MDRTAAEQNLSLRDPPQAKNPALQDSTDCRQSPAFAGFCYVFTRSSDIIEISEGRCFL